MSERIDPNEQLPELHLKMPGGEFIATPRNTTLFTFMGRLAMYDHVFIQTGDEDDETMSGTYIFNQHAVYEEMAAYLVEHNYPMLLNRIEVPDCDLNAFDRMVSQQAVNLDDELNELLGEGDAPGN